MMTSSRFVPVIASEAKQSVNVGRGRGMDCFVASLLAMTAVVEPKFIWL
jgi:hypothetical protein